MNNAHTKITRHELLKDLRDEAIRWNHLELGFEVLVMQTTPDVPVTEPVLTSYMTVVRLLAGIVSERSEDMLTDSGASDASSMPAEWRAQKAHQRSEHLARTARLCFRVARRLERLQRLAMQPQEAA